MTGDSLRVFQARFARGLLGGGATECEADFGTGYAIHARNVRASLHSALEKSFPVVQQLGGSEFFAQATRAFLAACPPRQGWLSAYGADFPAFIDDYRPAFAVPYLGDVARLEWARVAATFGEGVPGIDLAALAALSPDILMERSLRLNRCATIIRSNFPIFTIWAAHLDKRATGDLLAATSPAQGPEGVLITKALTGEAVVKRLGPGEAAFLSSLNSGAPIGAAWQSALDADPQFDLAGRLGELASIEALAELADGAIGE